MIAAAMTNAQNERLEEEQAGEGVPGDVRADEDQREQQERADDPAAARAGAPVGSGRPDWSARTARPRRRSGVRQVVEQARQVAAGLGGHRPADPVVELGLVEPAVGVVLAEELGDRVALGVGDADVLVGVADAARPLLGGGR